MTNQTQQSAIVNGASGGTEAPGPTVAPGGGVGPMATGSSTAGVPKRPVRSAAMPAGKVEKAR
jgi:hypothetical protein